MQKFQEITGTAPIAQATPVSPQKDSYTDLITKYLRAGEQSDIDTIVSRYADKVVYSVTAWLTRHLSVKIWRAILNGGQ